MSVKTYTTHQLTGKHLIDSVKDKRIGKVHHFIFFPSSKRVAGMTVKRPDAALMFHRKDLFVPLSGFSFEDGEATFTGTSCIADKSVEKLIKASWDDCVIWVGMPVMTKSGDVLGFVASVRFEKETGDVVSLTTENGVANDVLLGKYKIPAESILGFKRGKNERLSQLYANYNDVEPQDMGCILVSDDVLDFARQEGAAAVAGRASAVVAHKAKQGSVKVKAAVNEKKEKAQPALDKAARKAEEAIDTGAFALGKQLGKTTGMFSAFKEEFKNALADDDTESK